MSGSEAATVVAGLVALHRELDAAPGQVRPLTEDTADPGDPGGEAIGAVAIASQSPALLQECVRAAAHPPGFSVASASARLDGAELGTWIDLAARHPHTRALGLVLQDLHPAGTLSTTLPAVARALPVVALVTAEGERREALSCWLEERGVRVVGSLAAFLAGLRALSVLTGLPEDALRVAAPDADLATYLSRQLSRAGARAVAIGPEGADPDMIVTPDEEGGSRVRCAPHLAGIDPDAPWPTLPLDDLAPGLLALTRWESWLHEAPPAAGFRADRIRLRELAARLASQSGRPVARDTDREDAPEARLCRDLAAVCGLAAGRERRIRFPEDALVAAAELGYPVALQRSDTPTAEAPRVVGDSQALLEVTEGLLRAGGSAAPAVDLHAWLHGVPTLSLELARSTALGPCCRLTHEGRVLRTFGWPSLRALRVLLGERSAPPGLLAARSDALRRIVYGLCATLDALPAIGELHLRLHGTPTGDFLLLRLRWSACA